MSKPQSFENHRQFVPAFHGWLFGILLINLIWSGYRLATTLSIDAAVTALLACGLILLGLLARVFALRVQDRVIRLEMRLRLNELLPDTLRPRIHDFTPRQLVAMRFASDAELPELAATVLRDNVTSQDAIKKLIRNWTPDTLRA